MTPFLNDIFNSDINPVYGRFRSLGDIISGLLTVTLYITAFVAFFWLVWGVFQYIYAGGDKQKLAEARKRIVWAIVGFIIIVLAFAISQLAGQILPPQGNTPLTLIPTVYAKVNIEDEFGYGYIKDLGQGVSLLVTPTFSLATTSVVIYFLIGAFKYLTSGGEKEAVSSAQKMITHAIIGFILLMFIFFVLQFLLGSLFGITGLQLIKGV